MVVKKSKKEKSELIVHEADTEKITRLHKNITATKTPAFYVKDKGGVDYVEEGYMRAMLSEHFPVWSWEIVKYEFIGDKAISVHGRLMIEDNGVLRSFDAVASHRIAKNAKGYVNISNDIKNGLSISCGYNGNFK